MSYQASLDALLSVPELTGASICVTVTAADGTLLYDHNGTQLALPASNEKLVTCAFALFELGPDYHPKTKIWKLPDRTVVQSTGDPTLTFEQLNTTSEQIGLNRHLPVEVVEPYSPGIPGIWEVGDLAYRYAAPVAAFSVDQGAFELWNRNGKLELRPARYGIKIETAPAGDAKPDFLYDPVRRKLTVLGTYPRETKLVESLGTPSADEAAASIIGRSFKRVPFAPASSPSATIDGPALSQIVATCLTNSDNNMAENLLLMGGAKEGPLSDDPYEVAISRMKAFYAHVLGFTNTSFYPVDGSGLSRWDLISSQSLSKLLTWADTQSFRAIWHNALARPGKGTLRNRLRDIAFEGKTGSLTHVSSLSGYLETMDHRKLCVSVILNNFTCSDGVAHRVEDSFIKFLSENVP